MATREADIVPRNSSIEELVSQGAIAIRIQNDAMLSAAIARPRDVKRVLTAALAELDVDPDEAHAARYSIPFKKTDRRFGGDEQEKVERVEGLSINAAMALARCWGNCSVGANVLGQDAEGYNLEGYFIDLETNFRVSRPFYVSRVGKSRRYGTYTLDPQRLLMAIQAGASKALRNAILAGLPSVVKNPYEKKAIALVAGGDPDQPANQTMVTKVLNRFKAAFGVEAEQLERYIGEQYNDDAPIPTKDWIGRHLADVVALGQALKDGQVKMDEVFGAAESGERPTTPAPSMTKDAEVTARDDAPPGSNAPKKDETPTAPAPSTDTPPAPPAARKSRANF